MLKFFLTFPLFLLLLIFLFILFLGMLSIFLLQFFIRASRRYKYPQNDGTYYKQVIDLDERKWNIRRGEKGKWIAVLLLVLVITGLILLNYLKIDENGRIYWEKKQKAGEQNYL